MSETLHQLMIRRRSVRHFTDQSLTPEQVETLMEAALLAPSSRAKHSTRYILCDDREMLHTLSTVRGRGSAFLDEAALAVVLLGSAMHTHHYIEDVGIAASYLQLQAAALGLGSCWCQIFQEETERGEDANEWVRAKLSIPYQYDVVCIIAIGHPAEEPAPHDLESLPWERVHLEQFDETRPSDAVQ